MGVNIEICAMFDFHKETENSFCETIKGIVAQILFVQYAHSVRLIHVENFNKFHDSMFLLCALLVALLFSDDTLPTTKQPEIYLCSVSFSPVLGVLYVMAITLNQQEKQDFLLGVEEKFIFHILLQTQAFSLFSYSFFFFNHSRSVFVSLSQLCSAEE